MQIQNGNVTCTGSTSANESKKMNELLQIRDHLLFGTCKISFQRISIKLTIFR